MRKRKSNSAAFNANCKLQLTKPAFHLQKFDENSPQNTNSIYGGTRLRTTKEAKEAEFSTTMLCLTNLKHNRGYEDAVKTLE